MASTFGSFADFGGYTADEVRAMSRDEQLAMMAEWFGWQFEDPQNDTPYNKDLGGYVYLFGGPFDAWEQLQEEFSEVVDSDTVWRLVEKVEYGGTVEWSPQTDGDFYEHPDEDDRVASGEIVDGDGEWPPIVADRAPILPEPEARAEVVRRLDELEALIQPLVERLEIEAKAPPMMGHNNPPEELGIVQAVPRDEWQELKTAIDELRQQTQTPQPDTTVVERGNNRILSAAAKLAGWIKDRFNKAVDTGVVIGVAYGIANIETMKAALISTAQDVQVWLNSLNWPF